ncbi:hypothetical protein HB912_12135 [Listeria aquatica]|uniref:Uncharacterized protein n=1 Tax=Listeria aquatica TaxID=1494960 RepID=A0A841ZS72_9LIST|nr:hypothetical protein [Listeria aquatica]MBC1522397.1 hypothetical protein [Listeria aquatica]
MEQEELIQELELNQIRQKAAKETLEKEREHLNHFEEGKKEYVWKMAQELEQAEGDIFEGLLSHIRKEDGLCSRRLNRAVEDARRFVQHAEQHLKEQQEKGDKLLDLFFESMMEK